MTKVLLDFEGTKHAGSTEACINEVKERHPDAIGMLWSSYLAGDPKRCFAVYSTFQSQDQEDKMWYNYYCNFEGMNYF